MDLKKVKEEFKILAHTDYHINKQFSFIVHHPFIDSVIVYQDGKMKKIDEPGVWERYLEKLYNVIDECSSVSELFTLVTKPYLPTIFKYVNKYLDEIDYNQILRVVYTSCEYPNHDVNVSFKEWVRYFKKINQKMIMNKTEIDTLYLLDETVTIYRGVADKYKYYPAFSWTLDKERAKWYATRFDRDGIIYSLTIPKEEIIAYFDIDDEIIFNPKKYKEQIKIEKIKGRVI